MTPSSTLFASLLLSGLAAGQTTWYVDLNATPPGDGSQASPFVSIQAGILATTGAGDIVLVAPGDYFETIDYFQREIVVRAAEGPLATRLRPRSPSDPTVVSMGAEGGNTLEGFSILRDPPGGFGLGVLIPFNMVGVLRRCVLAGHGAGVRNDYDLFAYSCTITGNAVGITGDTISIHRISDSIVYGNPGENVPSRGLFGTVAIYSDIGALSNCAGPCPGNIDADPLFWDAAQGDFRLRPGSPCIDTGNPASPLDPDGSRIDMGAIPFDPFWAPGTESSCFGDALACPCGNGGSGEGGCDNFQATGGFVLQVADFAPNGAGGGTAQFLGTGYPPAAAPGSTLIRSPTLEVPPVVFGDGLRCISTAGLVRVGATVALGGTSLHSINHGAGAGTFHYQVWVRSNPATFCNPQAFNLSNAVSVTW